MKAKLRFFENSSFLATITEWNDWDYSLWNGHSIKIFKQNILKFIRLGPNKVFNIYNPHGVERLKRFLI